jgi:hypothetical protein
MTANDRSIVQIEADVTPQQYADFVRGASINMVPRRASVVFSICFFVLIVVLFNLFGSAVRQYGPPEEHLPSVEKFQYVIASALFVGGLAGIIYCAGQQYLVYQSYLKNGMRDGGAHIGRRTFELGEEGLRVAGSSGHTLTRWSAVQKVTETKDTILIWTDPGSGVFVPKSAFTGDEAIKRFISEIEQRLPAA